MLYQVGSRCNSSPTLEVGVFLLEKEKTDRLPSALKIFKIGVKSKNTITLNQLYIKRFSFFHRKKAPKTS